MKNTKDVLSRRAYNEALAKIVGVVHGQPVDISSRGQGYERELLFVRRSRPVPILPTGLGSKRHLAKAGGRASSVRDSAK